MSAKTKFEIMMEIIADGLKSQYGFKFDGSIMVFFNSSDEVVDNFNMGLSIPLVIKCEDTYRNYLVSNEPHCMFLEEFDEIYEVDINNALGIKSNSDLVSLN